MAIDDAGRGGLARATGPRRAILASGCAFVLILAMAATSNDAAIRRLGARRWRALHRFGQLYLFAVFFVTYSGRVAVDPSFWPGLVGVLGAGGLRAAAALQSLRLRRITLPTE